MIVNVRGDEEESDVVCVIGEQADIIRMRINIRQNDRVFIKYLIFPLNY
jgi:hypothetical protein